MKRTIRFAFMGLAAALAPSLAAGQYFAVGGIGYNILSASEHTAEVTASHSCQFYSGNINIPATVQYGGETYDVVALGEMAFYGAVLSGLTIPSSVTSIGERCFLFASGLASVNLPASVSEIGDMAFRMHNLVNFNVDTASASFRAIGGILYSKDTSTLVECPMAKSGVVAVAQGTRVIADHAFAYCHNITRVTLPEGLLAIGQLAFLSNTGLNNVVIPASVVRLGESPFGNCTQLTSLALAEGNTSYVMDGLLVYSAGGDSLLSAHKSADTMAFPNSLRYVGGFFGNCDIHHVSLADSTAVVGDYAFSNSTLASIDMPQDMALVGEWAFDQCARLSRVGMPSSLDSMAKGAFSSCTSLASIAIPDGLRSVPQEAFNGCTSLAAITWGDTVERIGSFAFANCVFPSLHFPPTLRTIDTGAFTSFSARRTMSEVVFSAPVDTIGPEAFTNRHIVMLRLANTVPPSSGDGEGVGCLYDAVVDSIIVPCGSLEAYLDDYYWDLFAEAIGQDCDGVEAPLAYVPAVGPNPATSRITIRTPGGFQRAELINAMGQRVMTLPGAGPDTTIDISPLPRGTYLLRIHTQGGTTVRKVVVR